MRTMSLCLTMQQHILSVLMALSQPAGCPKGISKPETDFGVKISVIRDDGKPVYQMGNLLMAPSSHFIFQKITLLLQVYLKGWGLFWRNAVLWEQQDLNH
jgi:hypothetical protein